VRGGRSVLAVAAALLIAAVAGVPLVSAASEIPKASQGDAAKLDAGLPSDLLSIDNPDGWMAVEPAIYTDANASFWGTCPCDGSAINAQVGYVDEQAGNLYRVWFLTFQAPLGQTLQVGSYPNAGSQRTLDQAYISVSGGNGDGASATAGSFGIESLTMDPSGVPLAYALTFEVQFGSSSLTGRLRYNSTDPLPALTGPGISTDLGSLSIGEASAPATFTFTAGGDESVAIGQVSIGGLDASDFLLSNDSCSGHDLGLSSSCTLGIAFKPTDHWERDAYLSIPYSASLPSRIVPLRGWGTVPTTETLVSITPDDTHYSPGFAFEISVSPNTFEYGNEEEIDCGIDGVGLPGTEVTQDGTAICYGPRSNGSHTLDVTFEGYQYFEPSSTTFDFDVSPATAISLTVSPDPPDNRTATTVTATVSNSTGFLYPGGTLTISDSVLGELGSGAISPDDPAVVASADLDSGPHHITATYSGVAGVLDPASAAIDVTVMHDGQPPAVPDPPDVTATAGVGAALVSWTVPANNGATITGYTVTSSPGGSTCPAGPGDTSCTISGLADGTWYSFSVTASNGVGRGQPGISAPLILEPTLVRYSGSDLFATAAAASANTFASPCHCTAYIATAYNFPDALAGAAAAGTVKGPILFVATTGAINSATAQELTRLKPGHIVVLGGTGVISAAVFAKLATYAPAGQTVRYGGADRFATAEQVAVGTFGRNCGCTAYIATAWNFPDALAGAAAAGTVPGPVLLVSATGAINASTKYALQTLKPSKIVVLGGTGVVSAAVYNALKAYAPAGKITRYAGSDRYGTAEQISLGTFPANCSCSVYISSGGDFNGALAAASAAAGTLKGPLLLVPTTGALPSATVAELKRLQPARIIVVGNTSVVSAAVYNLLAKYVS